MRMRIAAVSLSLLALAAPARGAEVEAWAVDPLIKVLHADQPGQDAERMVRISAARGEAEAGQIAVRAATPVKALKIAVGPLAAQGGAKLDDVEANFLNYQLVPAATFPAVEKELCAKMPARLPDAFSLDNPVPLEAATTRSAWITVRVPETASPGLYKGTVALDADGAAFRLPIELKVYEAVVPRERHLKIYNWLFYDSGNGWGQLRHRLGGEPWDDRDWTTLKAIARNMADHRQNLFTVPLIHNVLSGPEVFSVKVLKEGDGYRFDFSLFDRCGEVFLAEDPQGILVGGYLAVFGASGRALNAKGDLALRSPRIDLWDPKTGEKAGRLESADADSPAYLDFLRSLMPALQKHLEEKGWVGNFMMSVHDETFPQYAKARVQLVRFIRQAAPKIRFADANRNIDQAGSIDLWFPLPHHFEAYQDFYRERQAAGDEVGFYTCVTPSGYNMNRFISFPLLKTRLLHWYNYRFGLTGFLHWGYNAKFPPADLDKAIMDGDANLVYKDQLGFPVPSIRQEAMRDGIEDYELLRLAEAKDKALAARLCAHLVADCRRYSRSVADFRATRELLLELASAQQVPPKLAREIEALPTDQPWLLKDLPASLSLGERAGVRVPGATTQADGWKLVFSDDFERPNLGENWIAASGKWAIKGGRLTLLQPGDAAILYAKPLGPAQRIEFDAWAERGYPCDLSGLLCADPKQGGGFYGAYFFGYGCEMNAFSKLLIGAVDYRTIPLRMEPGERHHIVCERDGDRLSHWVDGKAVLNCLHKDRLDGPTHAQAGVYMYLPDQFVDNVKIFTR